MADVVATLLSFPPENASTLSPKEYDKVIDGYLKKLVKLPSSVWTKPVGKQNVLDLLNPAVNSIPYLAALTEQTRAVGRDTKKRQELLERAVIFCTSFDPVQVRYDGEQWTEVMNWTLAALVAGDVPTVSPVTTAMLRLDPTAGTFTTLHLSLLRYSFEAGVPSQTLPILDKDIYAFPSSPTKNVPEELYSEQHELSNAFITTKSGYGPKLQPEYVLEYYLLGAHVYIGLRDYDRARLFLEHNILHPSPHNATSALQVDAYKKWLLIGLLSEGRTWPLPRTHNTSVMKSIRSLAKAYDTLAEDFEKREFRKMAAEMEVGAQVWLDDGNMRLVKEVGDALLKYRVVDLQKTYAALPVSRVANFLGFAADTTAHMLAEMIRSGNLQASISQSAAPGDAILRFHPTSTILESDIDLEAQTRRIQDLTTFVRDADRRLQLTKEYVDVQRRAKRAGPENDMADQMDLTWDQPLPELAGVEDGDEDIMAA
ncbi:hypothetical protein B0A50_02705 [Salinomyces thailandicus]|uniref:COP9 signalosome complex subunit 3 n=1 Tax=Salinomyces thailandicus TaxID=706561 RepID=A0A4U0U6A4_9PEZI|nr:hypothetical protein B0A50_02705 [Salinomyces thailandica]